MRIRTLLVEDELHSLERLKTLLAERTEIELVGEAMDGLQAITLIDERKPELVFLDIQMPGATGFEVLERIAHKPMVIFMTAYDEYAIKAFEANALDYILKPSSVGRVAEAVARALERRRIVDTRFLASLREAVEREPYLKRFAVNRADEILLITEADVYCFKAEEKCVLLCTEDEEHFIDMTLKELESRLDPAVFCRIHKSHIVSLEKVKKIQRWFHGDLVVQLEDAKKSTLKVGRSYREELRRRLSL
ncbi:MAG: response regulator transcription factor [Candidatus Eisenbacteria bacterium]|nr:response regulator transcription factor [Candidatus Eisenbacteria bacterium]